MPICHGSVHLEREHCTCYMRVAHEVGKMPFNSLPLFSLEIALFTVVLIGLCWNGLGLPAVVAELFYKDKGFSTILRSFTLFR